MEVLGWSSKRCLWFEENLSRGRLFTFLSYLFFFLWWFCKSQNLMEWCLCRQRIWLKLLVLEWGVLCRGLLVKYLKDDRSWLDVSWDICQTSICSSTWLGLGDYCAFSMGLLLWGFKLGVLMFMLVVLNDLICFFCPYSAIWQWKLRVQFEGLVILLYLCWLLNLLFSGQSLIIMFAFIFSIKWNMW